MSAIPYRAVSGNVRPAQNLTGRHADELSPYAFACAETAFSPLNRLFLSFYFFFFASCLIAFATQRSY